MNTYKPAHGGYPGQVATYTSPGRVTRVLYHQPGYHPFPRNRAQVLVTRRG